MGATEEEEVATGAAVAVIGAEAVIGTVAAAIGVVEVTGAAEASEAATFTADTLIIRIITIIIMMITTIPIIRPATTAAGIVPGSVRVTDASSGRWN